MGKLRKFEGRDVIGTKVAVSNAGDGLSEALAIDPNELVIGATYYVVLECVCDRIAHIAVKDTTSLQRVQRLRAGTASLVDKELVADVLEEQRVKNEQARGVERLDFTEGDEAGGGDGDA